MRVIRCSHVQQRNCYTGALIWKRTQLALEPQIGERSPRTGEHFSCELTEGTIMFVLDERQLRPAPRNVILIQVDAQFTN